MGGIIPSRPLENRVDDGTRANTKPGIAPAQSHLATRRARTGSHDSGRADARRRPRRAARDGGVLGERGRGGQDRPCRSGQELADAQAALVEAVATASSVPTSSTTPATTTTATLVPPATIERVRQAEQDLAKTGEGITAATPLAEATAEYNSAAFALQVAWLRLFHDAGCLTDAQQAKAVEQVMAYTTTLQTELQQVGYYDGPVDGIYGPATADAVKRLQADGDLPETGFVDRATAEALEQRLADLGLQTAAADLLHTAAVQTVLTAAGFWHGSIDGVWTDELTAALRQFQIALGVEPTGVVDAATLAAYQQARADLLAPPTPITASTPTTTSAPAAARPPTTPSTATTTTTTTATGGEATVLVANSNLGPILTAANGMTVYLFMPDAQGTPTCTDSCAQAWPPLTVDDVNQLTGGDGVDALLLGTTELPAAGTQVTYNGWPLYFYSGDSAPGDTNGQGQSGVWYVLDPTGNAIGNA
jgi:predicted lipoprotein with Yx(FWY)xxD motif